MVRKPAMKGQVPSVDEDNYFYFSLFYKKYINFQRDLSMLR